MQCFTCRKDIPLGSSCWPITNRTQVFRISSPPTVCDDCFKCSVCRAHLALDKYCAVGNVLYCNEHEPAASSSSSSSQQASSSQTSSSATATTGSNLFSFFPPTSQSTSPTTTTFSSLYPPALSASTSPSSSGTLSGGSGSVSPLRTSPRAPATRPRETLGAMALPRWPGTATDSAHTAATTSSTVSSSSSSSSSSAATNVFTVPTFTPGVADTSARSVTVSAGSAHGRESSKCNRKNTGKGRTSRINTTLATSSPVAATSSSSSFSSSPFPIARSSTGPLSLPSSTSSGLVSSNSSASAAAPASSALHHQHSLRVSPSGHSRSISASGEMLSSSTPFAPLAPTSASSSPTPTPPFLPLQFLPASFSLMDSSSQTSPRQTWPPPPTRVRSSLPVPEMAVDNGSEPGLIDKRKRRPKRAVQSRNSATPTDEAVGDVEARLKQLAKQLEMVRLEKDELEDASVEVVNALTKDEEIATLRARLALFTRRADQAEARAAEAEDKAVRYKAHAEVMQQLVDNTLKALHDVETAARDVSKLQREVVGLKEERVEMTARVKEYREMIEHLSQRGEEHVKEIDRLKGNFSPSDLSLEELIQLENTLDEGKRKVSEVRVALQVSAEEKKKKECVLCFDEQKDTVFVPCGHLACCHTCSKKVLKCPICRKAITHTVPVYDC